MKSSLLEEEEVFVVFIKVIGILKGFYQLLNIVIDQTEEIDLERNLGLVVCRGTSLMTICPVDG